MRKNAPELLTAALTLVSVVALFAFRDVPMVDLPQHAAQIASWVHWGDPAYRTGDLELNFRTPYLLAYPLARIVAPLVGVVAALKLVVALGLVAHVAAFAHLVRRLGHDPWLMVLGVPTALGYAFCFGFVSFLVAVPVLFVAVAEALRHAERPALTSGAVLGLLLSVSLLAHGIVLALAVIAVVPLLFRGGGSLVGRLSPLAAPALFGALWILPGTSATRIGDTYWALGWDRILELGGMLVGIGSADALASCAGVALLVGSGFLVGVPSRRVERWLPLVSSVAGYMLFPTLFRGVGPLSPRFAVLVVPGLLLAFEPDRERHLRAPIVLGRSVVAFSATAWLMVFALRLPAYNRETDGVHALIAEMEKGLRVRPIVFERESKAFPGLPAFLHLPAYYQVEKGGVQGYSFAMYPLSVVRYRSGVKPLMGGGAEWRPEAFDWQRERASYDYFVVHSRSDRTRALFGEHASRAVVLQARAGDWWVYRQAEPLAALSSRTE